MSLRKLLLVAANVVLMIIGGALGSLLIRSQLVSAQTEATKRTGESEQAKSDLVVDARFDPSKGVVKELEDLRQKVQTLEAWAQRGFFGTVEGTNNKNGTSMTDGFLIVFSHGNKCPLMWDVLINNTMRARSAATYSSGLAPVKKGDTWKVVWQKHSEDNGKELTTGGVTVLWIPIVAIKSSAN